MKIEKLPQSSGGRQAWRLSRLTKLAASAIALCIVFAAASSAAPRPMPSAEAAGGTVTISVGYADTYAGSFVPTPWFGSTNVIWMGCPGPSGCGSTSPGSGNYDSGAVLITNGTSAAVTIDKVDVLFGTGGCNYQIWETNAAGPPTGLVNGLPVSLPAGASLILTQTQPGNTPGCHPSNAPGIMDGSDIPATQNGNCTPDGIVPTVSLTINGTAETYTDSTQVLNTKGYDTGECAAPNATPNPQGHVYNEGIPWTQIGTFTPPVTGNQGCTPGYWKNHTNAWTATGYSPTQTVGSVFTGFDSSIANETLLAALQGGGGSGLVGKETILARAAVAALLNSKSVSYPLTTAQVISQVNSALATQNQNTINNLATTLDNDNNGQGGCPLS